MTVPIGLHVWTMRTDGLDETLVAPWLTMLDPGERERAARFVFARNRIEFIAAHALLRAALSQLLQTSPVDWEFVATPLGKPSAVLAGERAEVSFNLSHTEGMVGLTACLGGGWAVGFDLEPADRKLDLAIADHFFAPREVTWLKSLPQPLCKEGFLRLWTLKEAFIKATGKGLSLDLAAFSFDVFPPRIAFAPCLPENEADWWFEQRLLGDGFIAAIGLRRAASLPVERWWRMVEPGELRPTGLNNPRAAPGTGGAPSARARDL